MHQVVSKSVLGDIGPTLALITLAAFAASLSTRALDPVLPNVAAEFGVDIMSAAGVATGYMLAFALIQPLMGPMADLVGKARLMIACLALLGLINLLTAIVDVFWFLVVTRILAGMAAGGVVPVALSLTSDLVTHGKRQAAIGRITSGVMVGTLLGASGMGLLNDLHGWRSALALVGSVGLCAAMAVALGVGRRTLMAPERVDLSAVRRGYRVIFANPNARVCYTAVFIEGCCVFGLFPFVASFMLDVGQPSSSLAGFAIGGFAVGGLLYATTISLVLPWLGLRRAMLGGAGLVSLQLLAIGFGSAWQVQSVNLLLMGWGFSLIHGCLQVFASELSSHTRGTAMSFHVFFYSMGQSIGPVAYGLGLRHFGKLPTLCASAGLMAALGVACALLLKERAENAESVKVMA